MLCWNVVLKSNSCCVLGRVYKMSGCLVDISELSGGGGGGELRIWLTSLLCPPPSPSLPDDASAQHLSLALLRGPQRCRFARCWLWCEWHISHREVVKNRAKLGPLLLLLFNEHWDGDGSLSGAGVLQGPRRCLDWPHHVSESHINCYFDVKTMRLVCYFWCQVVRGRRAAIFIYSQKREGWLWAVGQKVQQVKSSDEPNDLRGRSCQTLQKRPPGATTRL